MKKMVYDGKGCNIKFRLKEDMRIHVEQKASENDISMSEYVRMLIRKDMVGGN